ncbi:MAG: phenylalanine--tRNA ligase subunit beta, partial [Candidatus Saccharimonadales bacterium]
MKVSVNSIRIVNEIYGSASNPAPNGVDDLLQKIGSQLAGIDEVITYGERFRGVLVARVASVADHPDADRLHVCKIDDGGKAEGIERDENGYVQVVCGAPNVREGLVVAWLPPGATVPNTIDKDPFMLEARALRGVVSNGMLASGKELTIGDSHDGILELDTDVAPGTPFAQAYDLEGDVVIDMENKMFTHRPDCFGQLGIARELEGIQHRAYKSPEWYQTNPDFVAVEADELKLEVQNEIPELTPRFTAVTMRDVMIKSSPVWLQIHLSKLGIRPINNIVDYTNFFMLETGQPLHAYDYDKVVAQDEGADHATIVVRKPRDGEKITLLNGKEIQPRAEAIMIATRDKLIGLGGVMGGGDTEVDDNTKNIIIESANFDMYSIRRTAMAHGVFTDAVTRFNKGQSPLQNVAVLAKIVDEIRRFADGKVASALIDDNHLPAEMLERNSVHPAVRVSPQFINTRLGFALSAEEMATLLRNVEFDVEVDNESGSKNSDSASDNQPAGTLIVKAPFWRTDITISEDVVEEIGRLYGFDHLPLELPKRSVTPAPKDDMLALKARTRDILAAAGANELLTYSFVHGNLLEKSGQDIKDAFQLSNALSPDLQYFRLTVLPSLLDKIHPNIKAGFDQFAIFELGKGHNLLHANTDDGLPAEFSIAALAVTANDKIADKKTGAAFYQARAFLDQLGKGLGLDLAYTPITETSDVPIIRPYDLSRSAFVSDLNSGAFLGIVGEFKTGVRKGFKLPAHTAGFEISLDELVKVASAGSKYAQLPRFPKVEQDICLKVPATTSYADVYDFATKTMNENHPVKTRWTLSPDDIYQRQDDADNKQITL